MQIVEFLILEAAGLNCLTGRCKKIELVRKLLLFSIEIKDVLNNRRVQVVYAGLATCSVFS